MLLAFAISAVASPPIQSQESQRSSVRKYEVHVTPEMRRHSRINDTIYFVGFAWSVGALIFVLASGLSARFRDFARRIGKRPFFIAMLFFVILSASTEILQFPLTFYADFFVPHQFDLTTQSFSSWMWDFAKEFMVGTTLGAIIAALALLAIRKFTRWWLPLWLGSIPIMLFLIVIAPVVIDPLFNTFVPLKDSGLRTALLDEASRAGIEGSRVYEVDKSKQTKTMNAYVTGLGPSNRIVLWDTIIQKMDRDELLAVMGHEMGHYVLNHIWKGFAWSVLLSLAVCFLAQQIYERGLEKWGARWGVEGRADPAALPWLLVIVSMVIFLLSPAINGISRHVEHEADIFGLELTHLNGPMASSFVKFAEDSKVDPSPNAFIEFWRYTHPSLSRRIEFVLNYKPWERGESNHLWKPKR